MKFYLYEIIPIKNEYYEPVRKYTSKVYGFGLFFGMLIGYGVHDVIMTIRGL